MNWSLTLVVAILLAVSTASTEETPRSRSEPILSLCDLVANWKANHRQRVRVRAVMAVGPEASWLYDPECRDGEGLVDVDFDKKTKGVKKLDRLFSDRRAWVVLEGVFYGPEPYQDIDPRMPQGIRKQLEKAQRRYGHMDMFENMIEVTKVVEVREFAGEVPKAAKPAQSPGTTLPDEAQQVGRKK
jgi:hypothetical protein